MSSFGIDIGGNQIKVCVWNNNKTASTGVGSEAVLNNRDKRSSPNTLFLKDTSFNICGQHNESVLRNLSNYISNYKTLVGSNKFYSKDTCEKAIAKDSNRAYYAIKYNKRDIELDVEVVASLILQYCYYICLKTDSIFYDVFPMELPSLLNKPHFMTIAIPSYYTISHIRGLEAALSLRDLGDVSFIRENVAVALDYGWYTGVRGNYSPEGRTVLFCDMGSIASTVTIVHFTNNGLEILGSRYQMIGGNNLDAILVELMYKKCCENVGDSVERTPVVNHKLRQAAEKVKRDLSNPGMHETYFDVSTICDVDLDEDRDEASITREEFESTCNKQKVYDDFYRFVINSIKEICGDRVIDVVETVGSGMRIPRFQNALLSAVQHSGNSIEKISSTMNKEEACARGCALFSHLYWEEKSICCREDKVVLMANDKEIAGMNVCACGCCEGKQDMFTIQNHDSLEEGEDHDWNEVMTEGKKFMDEFVNTCDDLNNRQLRRNLLEQSCSELRSYLSTCEEKKPDLLSVVEKDNEFVDSIDILVRSKAVHPIDVYDEKVSIMNQKLNFYRSQLSVETNRKREGDVEYVGVWMNNQMTGSFDCYDLKGVHLFTAIFNEGILHGKMTTYYESKAIKSIQYYKDGKLDGKYIGYHENGQLAEVCTYQDDKKEGYWQVYYDNGQLAKEGKIQDGKDIFIKLYHHNGTIAYLHLFNGKGKLYASYEFSRDGELVYAGKMPNGNYSGKSLVFYRNEYYAKVLFSDGIICKKGSFYPSSIIKKSVLDKQYKQNNELDCSVIEWKKIVKDTFDVPQCREVTLSYAQKSHTISLMEYQTHFDILRKEGNGEVAQTDDNGNIRYLSQAEIRKRSLYDSDIQSFTTKYFTIFGDLKKMVEFEASPVRTTKCISFYPSGCDDGSLSKPEDCRKKSEGEMKNNKGCGHWKEYYNNGILRCEGEKENGEWKEKKCYYNNGRLME